MQTNSENVVVLGVPLDLGAENLGVGMGADTFRYQGIVQKLRSAGLSVTDAGNVAVKSRSKVPVGTNLKLHRVQEIVRVSEETATITEKIARDGKRAVVLGGDHSICLGAVSGASVGLAATASGSEASGADNRLGLPDKSGKPSKPGRSKSGKLGLIYFDAHGDMNTDKTTPTGNIHGMQLASLMGFGAPELAHVHGKQIKVAKENLLHIGGCDFDQAETDLVARENLQTFSMLDLLTHNLAPLFPMIDKLASQVDHIWVSLDLDAIDALYAPGAGMPNKKGLTYREIAAIADYIGQKCNVIGIDVVEYNPLQDEQGKTVELAIELIATFFGKEYSWYTHYLEKNKLG